MRKAIYPGSFDPVTYGHIEVIKRAAKLFDLIYVAVVNNPILEPLFTTQERLEMLKNALAPFSNVKAESFDRLLVDYANQKEAVAIIRGLRAVSDFDYEFQMALTNQKINSQIETVFLMSSQEYTYLSSSLVKEIARFGGEVKMFVPELVSRKLSGKYSQKS